MTIWLENHQVPTTCPCGNNFDIQHNMSCKKGGFMSLRHNNLRDLTSKDTEIEPKLKPLFGDELQGRTSNTSNKARVDINFSTQGFLTPKFVAIATNPCISVML